jgi:hypothetical protein
MDRSLHEAGFSQGGELLLSRGAEYARKRPRLRRKMSNPSLRHLASYARIATHISDFSVHEPVNGKALRNKIAQMP